MEKNEINLILKTNITFIISNINKALAFEWVASYLNKDKFNLNFILLYPEESELEKYLKENNFIVERIKYSSKKKEIPLAIIKTYRFLKRNKTQIVHTHLFDANIVGLSAAWLARIPKRIHTRHHSNYHHLYFPKAIKYDKLANRLSTDIVAISEVVKNILITKEQVDSKKVHLIHHGFLLNEFMNVSEKSISKIKEKYNPNNIRPVVGVISRFTEWKGVQFIIPAFKKLLQVYPNALIIMVNAEGDYRMNIKEILKTIPEKNYIETTFESDIFALYKLFDVFVHVPISPEVEAFGQTYVEALASGVPSVFTLSGIANEFILDHYNALVVPFQDSNAIVDAVMVLLENKALVASLIENGKNDVLSRFDLNQMILSLEKLYE